jgi:hypothetical protein
MIDTLDGFINDDAEYQRSALSSLAQQVQQANPSAPSRLDRVIQRYSRLGVESADGDDELTDDDESNDKGRAEKFIYNDYPRLAALPTTNDTPLWTVVCHVSSLPIHRTSAHIALSERQGSRSPLCLDYSGQTPQHSRNRVCTDSSQLCLR